MALHVFYSISDLLKCLLALLALATLDLYIPRERAWGNRKIAAHVTI